MKKFIKSSLLVILIVLLLSSFINDKNDQIKTSLDNDVLIVDKGNNILDDATYSDNSISNDNNTNVFSSIGYIISNIFITIVNYISSIISKILIYIPY